MRDGELTLAHDTLTSQQRRAEYDEYLEQTSKNRAMSAVLDDPMKDVAAIKAAIDAAMAAAAAAAPPPPPPPQQQRVVVQQPAPQQPAPQRGPQRIMSQDESLKQRREALARKLMAGRKPGAPPPPPPPPRPLPREEMAAISERATEALRLRHEAAIADAKRQQLQRYLEAGRAALESQDYAAAANAYRWDSDSNRLPAAKHQPAPCAP